MSAGLTIDSARRSGNHGERPDGHKPDCIVLHYTGMQDGPSAVDWLCNPASQVSCHYVVTEAGAILQLVDEDRRAWHAGRSVWKGETDLNSASIGIEIVNGGHDFDLPPFPEAQLSAVIALCRDVMLRHGIQPERILAHSDIAPARKRDPGERFPWRQMAAAGVGLWPDVGLQDASFSGWSAGDVQRHLLAIGYGVPMTGAFDDETATVLRGFQRRYRPDRIDGIADDETMRLLSAVRRRRAGAI